MSEAVQQKNRNWPTFIFISIYLIGQLIWRVTTRAGSWPLSPMHYVSMAIDLALIVAVVALNSRLASYPGEDASRKAIRTALLVAAVFCGVAMFAIRFSSDVGWWTGHVRNWNE